MQFKSLIVLAFASAAIASPVIEQRDAKTANLLVRALNLGAFTAAEIANVDKATCCCCVPIGQIKNVDVLHRIIAASDVF